MIARYSVTNSRLPSKFIELDDIIITLYYSDPTKFACCDNTGIEHIPGKGVEVSIQTGHEKTKRTGDTPWHKGDKTSKATEKVTPRNTEKEKIQKKQQQLTNNKQK